MRIIAYSNYPVGFLKDLIVLSFGILRPFSRLGRKWLGNNELDIAFPEIGLLYFTGIYFLWGRTSIDPSALSYAALGPVMTNLGSGQPVRIKVKFELKDPNLRNRIAEMDTLIKDKMLMILASLDEKDILGEQGFQSLKDSIKSVAGRLVKENEIKGVCFSEILMFDRRT